MRLGRKLLNLIAKIPYLGRFKQSEMPITQDSPYTQPQQLALPPAPEENLEPEYRPSMLALPPSPLEEKLKREAQEREEAVKKDLGFLGKFSQYFTHMFSGATNAPQATAGPTEMGPIDTAALDAEWNEEVGYAMGETGPLLRKTEQNWNEIANDVTPSEPSPLYTRMHRRKVEWNPSGKVTDAAYRELDDIAQELRLKPIYAPAQRSAQPQKEEIIQPQKEDPSALFDEVFESLGIEVDQNYTRPKTNAQRESERTIAAIKNRREELRYELIEAARARGETVSDDAYKHPQRTSKGLPQPKIRTVKQSLISQLHNRTNQSLSQRVGNSPEEVSAESMYEGTIFEPEFQEQNYLNNLDVRNFQDIPKGTDIYGVRHDEHGTPYFRQKEDTSPLEEVDFSDCTPLPEEKPYQPPVSPLMGGQRPRVEEQPVEATNHYKKPTTTTKLPLPNGNLRRRAQRKASIESFIRERQSQAPQSAASNSYPLQDSGLYDSVDASASATFPQQESGEYTQNHASVSQSQQQPQLPTPTQKPIYGGVIEAEIVGDSGLFDQKPSASQSSEISFDEPKSTGFW